MVTLALYNPVNRHPFVNYDDDRYVTENPHVRQGLTADTFNWALTSTEQANWHPLTWMSHALDVSLFRLNPAGHHFTSILLHAVNVILLFLLLMWATNRFGPSLFVAALFALHPMKVESVAWVAERKNVLCTMFFFLTLWAYGWYARKPDWKRYLAVVALFAAGLASKPMVITLPFVLLLLDYWPLARVRGEKIESSNVQSTFPWSRLVLEKLPLLALSAASAVITMQAQQAGGAIRTTAEFSFGVRIANAIYAYAMYLWKMVWPARLAPLYPHPGDSLASWQVLVAALVLHRDHRAGVAIACAALSARRLVLVSGNAGSGHRPRAGWRGRHGRPLRLHPADWHLRDDFVWRRGFCATKETRSRARNSCRYDPRCPCIRYSSPDRILAEQRRSVVSRARRYGEQFRRGRQSGRGADSGRQRRRGARSLRSRGAHQSKRSHEPQQSRNLLSNAQPACGKPSRNMRPRSN